MQQLWWIVVLGSLWAASAQADTWSLGTVVERRTGLSMQYHTAPLQAVHVSSSFFEQDQFTMEGHWQRFFYPDFSDYNYEVYTGVGLRGEAVNKDGFHDAYYLAIPLGLQWNPRHVPIEVFGEGAALVGKLPSTALRGRARAGLRAVF